MIIQAEVTSEMINACLLWRVEVIDYSAKQSELAKNAVNIETVGFLWWKKEVKSCESSCVNKMKAPPLCRLIDMHYNNQPILHEPDTSVALRSISELYCGSIILLEPRELRDVKKLMEYYK